MKKRKFLKSMIVRMANGYMGEGFVLDYFIVRREITCGAFSINTYGVEIVRSRKENGKKICEQYRIVYDIFGTEKEALALAEKLADNFVTPVALMEVLKDMMGKHAFSHEENFVEAV